ncbi:transposase [Rubinisphaera margarita]|uniref:transposase n=1 Tax=Rubinisphaera margarita TaxID=2909586 RepID=UPI001EE7C66A|nr:transposase [Rubinisphaera margarita]MCG6157243.1 hypothetical protein [Rubinisphaera margarita]
MARATKSNGDCCSESWMNRGLIANFGASTEPSSGRLAVRRAGKKRSRKNPHTSGGSRGGFSTKTHLVCDVSGCPIHFELSPGQAHENTTVVERLNGIDAEMTTGAGKVIAWPLALAGDKE